MSVANKREVRELLSKANLSYHMIKGSSIKAQPSDITEHGDQTVVLYDVDGNPLLILTPDMDGQSPAAVNVTAVDTIIIPANPNRRALVMTNDSDTNIYIGIDESSAPNGAPRINAGGGVYTLSRYGAIFSTGDIHASHGGAGAKVLTYQEFH